jgi:hypothetical protein
MIDFIQVSKHFGPQDVLKSSHRVDVSLNRLALDID